MKNVEQAEKLLGDIATPDLMEWLKENGFFIKPASINHHSNEDGGLFLHSRLVAEELITLTKKNNLTWQRKESPVIVGLFHDLCKLDNYEMVIDEPGVEMMGGSVVGRTYRWQYNPEPMMQGHGDKSVMLLSTLLQLTEEEMLCIRYHMGAFTDKSEWAYYTRAVQKYPNVLWVHHADMIAAHVLKV